MRGSSGRSSEQRRLGCPVHALAAVTALLAFLAFSSSAMASEPPTIERESVSGVSEHDATLEAQIETGGLYTGYQFEIDTNSSYNFTRFVCPFSFPGSAQCESIVDGEPLPAGLVEPNPQYIPAGSGDRSVSLDLASIGATLQPSTTYHYRVTASNGGQGAQGPDQTFTTPSMGAAGTAPSIDSESVSHITSTDATLEAQINTEGLETMYEFVLTSHHACESANPPCEPPIYLFPLPSGTLLGSFVDQSVSIDLNSAHVKLAPGDEYSYSVSATSAAGNTSGHPQTFTAPEEGVQPLNTTTSPGLQLGAGTESTGGVTIAHAVSATTAGQVTSPPKNTLKPKVLTNAHQLAQALKLCAKKPKKQRASCRKQAHKRYGTTGRKANDGAGLRVPNKR